VKAIAVRRSAFVPLGKPTCVLLGRWIGASTTGMPAKLLNLFAKILPTFQRLMRLSSKLCFGYDVKVSKFPVIRT
jgi:hypothetical protein